jgi:hypothetical protein
VDYNGLPLFLIDANVFPGSSGSPVMVLDEGGYSTKRGISLGSRAYILGLVDEAYIHTEQGIVKFIPLPTQFVPTYDEHQYFNLGAVIKAKAILNTMSEFVKVNLPTNSTPPNPLH